MAHLILFCEADKYSETVTKIGRTQNLNRDDVATMPLLLYVLSSFLHTITMSVLQCTTQRVYSKRNLFETLASMNIARDHHIRIIYQSDNLRHAPDVCEGICNKMILHFSYYCKYGVLVFGDDGTGPADESKRTKRVQGWARQIMGGGFYYL